MQEYQISKIEREYVIKKYTQEVKTEKRIHTNKWQAKVLWVIIFMKLNNNVLISRFRDDYDLYNIVFAILSIKLDITFIDDNNKDLDLLKEMSNENLEYYYFVISACKKYNPNLYKEIFRSDVKISVKQNHSNDDILQIIFPELFENN